MNALDTSDDPMATWDLEEVAAAIDQGFFEKGLFASAPTGLGAHILRSATPCDSSGFIGLQIGERALSLPNAYLGTAYDDGVASLHVMIFVNGRRISVVGNPITSPVTLCLRYALGHEADPDECQVIALAA